MKSGQQGAVHPFSPLTVFIMLNGEESKLLDELRVDSPDFVVIVEGEKDVRALRALGVSRIAMLNRYSGVQELCDELAEKGVKRAVILTDFDRTGVELARKIRDALYADGISVDDKLRKRIHEAFKVRYIERLHRIVESIRGE